MPTCNAFLTDANGNPGSTPVASDQALPALNIPSLGSGGAVAPGTAFTVTSPGGPVSLPGSITKPVTATILEVKNIVLHFSITGAASVGKPTLSGGTAIGATASATNSSFTLTLPGSKKTSTLPKGAAFFPGGSTFTTPKISMNVKAPNSSGMITTSLKTMQLFVAVQLAPGAAGTGVFLDCTAPANTVGSVAVVVPGAPIAVNDEASTKPGQPVTVNVLANDLPNGFGQKPDPATLTVASNPARRHRRREQRPDRVHAGLRVHQFRQPHVLRV